MRNDVILTGLLRKKSVVRGGRNSSLPASRDVFDHAAAVQGENGVADLGAAVSALDDQQVALAALGQVAAVVGVEIAEDRLAALFFGLQKHGVQVAGHAHVAHSSLHLRERVFVLGLEAGHVGAVSFYHDVDFFGFLGRRRLRRIGVRRFDGRQFERGLGQRIRLIQQAAGFGQRLCGQQRRGVGRIEPIVGIDAQTADNSAVGVDVAVIAALISSAIDGIAQAEVVVSHARRLIGGNILFHHQRGESLDLALREDATDHDGDHAAFGVFGVFAEVEVVSRAGRIEQNRLGGHGGEKRGAAHDRQKRKDQFLHSSRSFQMDL